MEEHRPIAEPSLALAKELKNYRIGMYAQLFLPLILEGRKVDDHFQFIDMGDVLANREFYYGVKQIWFELSEDLAEAEAECQKVGQRFLAIKELTEAKKELGQQLKGLQAKVAQFKADLNDCISPHELTALFALCSNNIYQIPVQDLQALVDGMQLECESETDELRVEQHAAECFKTLNINPVDSVSDEVISTASKTMSQHSGFQKLCMNSWAMLLNVLQGKKAALHKVEQDLEYAFINLSGTSFKKINQQICIATLFKNKERPYYLRAVGVQWAGAELPKAHLSFDCLAYSDLRGVGFEESTLRAVCFFHSNLQGAKLRDSEIQGVDFRECRLDKADLRDCGMGLVLFQKASMVGAVLTTAALAKKDTNHTTKAQSCDFTGADLRLMNARSRKFSDCIFTDAKVSGINLDWVEFRDCRLDIADEFDEEASLEGTAIYRCVYPHPRQFGDHERIHSHYTLLKLKTPEEMVEYLRYCYKTSVAPNGSVRSLKNKAKEYVEKHGGSLSEEEWRVIKQVLSLQVNPLWSIQESNSSKKYRRMRLRQQVSVGECVASKVYSDLSKVLGKFGDDSYSPGAVVKLLLGIYDSYCSDFSDKKNLDWNTQCMNGIYNFLHRHHEVLLEATNKNEDEDLKLKLLYVMSCSDVTLKESSRFFSECYMRVSNEESKYPSVKIALELILYFKADGKGMIIPKGNPAFINLGGLNISQHDFRAADSWCFYTKEGKADLRGARLRDADLRLLDLDYVDISDAAIECSELGDNVAVGLQLIRQSQTIASLGQSFKVLMEGYDGDMPKAVLSKFKESAKALYEKLEDPPTNKQVSILKAILNTHQDFLGSVFFSKTESWDKLKQCINQLTNTC